ncbi:MAG: HAMP domain-containing sensor histidine kinase [Pseudomonadota bacterium]
MKRRLPVRRHGLTIKLILIYIGMIFLGVVLVSMASRHAYRDNFENTFKPHLRLYVEYIRTDLGDPPQLERARALTQKIPVQIYYRDANSQWSTDGRQAPRLGDIDFWDHHKRRKRLVKFGELDDQEVAVLETPEHTLFFVAPHDDDDFSAVKLLPPLIVVLVFIALYYLTQRLFAPLHKVRRAVNAFGKGDMQSRVNIRRRDELGDVANSFNEMADRIEQMLESKRQLLLAISHELRSPLTRARVATAMLADDDQRGEIESELSEMEALIAELLETERLNADHQALRREEIDLVDLVNRVLEDSDGHVDMSAPDALEISVDPARLRLVIKNLLDNARKYTPKGNAAPEIAITSDETAARIQVKDHGEGISGEHLAHISEPFYRVDPARQRATGGYGLGLYLCRVIIEAHGGQLHVESSLGVGTQVVCTLPLSLESPTKDR